MVNNDNNKLKENHSPRKSNSSIKEIMKHIEINTSKNMIKMKMILEKILYQIKKNR
jgi:hypothetical protein